MKRLLLVLPFLALACADDSPQPPVETHPLETVYLPPASEVDIDGTTPFGELAEIEAAAIRLAWDKAVCPDVRKLYESYPDAADDFIVETFERSYEQDLTPEGREELLLLAADCLQDQ